MERRLKGVRLRDVVLRWQGGRAVVPIQWRAAERFWWHIGSPAGAGRLWFALGHAARPRPEESPTCEINIPTEGFDRRLGGAVLRDPSGELFLGHSGRIGGGRAGADKRALRAFLSPGVWRPVLWPDGKTTELHVVGHVGGARFARQVGRFVREIDRFKRAVAEGGTAAPMHGFLGADGDLPPLDGADSAASLAACCEFGLVLDALAAELERRGASGEADPAHDLFGRRFAGQRLLFEIAADDRPATVYAVIGRLAARRDHHPRARLVAVLPQHASAWAAATLRRAGVALVRHGWARDRAVFAGLDEALT